MERVINDPTGLTVRDLDNYDWDVIRTNITIDAPALLAWCNDTMEANKDAAFNWNKTELMNDRAKQMTKMRQEKGEMWGYPNQWTMQWATQRSDALPNPFLCDPNIYPEVTSDTFYQDFHTDLTQFNNGYYKKIKDTLNKSETEKDCYKITRLVSFLKDEGLCPHYDIEKGSYLVRMHIQAHAHDQCVWKFGDEQDREYKIMETGRVYLFNTANLHSAINTGDEPWTFIHNDPDDEAITRLLNTTLHISP